MITVNVIQWNFNLHYITDIHQNGLISLCGVEMQSTFFLIVSCRAFSLTNMMSTKVYRSMDICLNVYMMIQC